MDPTLGIMCFLLSEAYDVVADFTPDEDFAFAQWRIHNGEKPEPGVLYLMNGQIPSTRSWQGTFAVGLAEPPARLPEGCHYLHVREKRAKDRRRPVEKRFLDLANALQAASRRFDRWVLHLERETGGNGADYADILQWFERETGLVSLLVNKNLRHIAASDSFAASNPWYEASSASMDFNMVNELMADEAFLHAIEQRSAFYYHYEGQGTADSACFNVFVDGRYEARLLVQSPSGAKLHGQLAVTSLLGTFIADMMAGYASRHETRLSDPAFEEAVASLLEAPPVRVDELRRKLEAHGWAMEHRYCVHVFRFMQPESESVTRRYYESSIARLFVGCCVVARGDLICCVRNLTLEGAHTLAAQQGLVLFLRENLCWAGSSPNFEGIANLSAHYDEALSALRLGLKAGGTEWNFQFQDYVLGHVLDRAVDGIERRSLFHPAYAALREHDRAHGTHLTETAECFMECKYNVTRAAEALGIHRSSMLTRLERIQEVSGFDWDDADERLLLALTFALASSAE